MIFKKWEGTLYHESLRDLIMEETLLVEILPGKNSNPAENSASGESPREIKAIITEEGKTFEASGQFYPAHSSLILVYKDKPATIKADFLVGTMKIVGKYIFKDKNQREISMVIVLSPH